MTSGVITETGPLIPVSIGFSGADSESWEDVVDENGQPTGIEKKSFKLNVLDGSTESIDEEWDMVRRINGLEDGTNSRRVVCGGYEDEWQDSEEHSGISDDGREWQDSDEQSEARDEICLEYDDGYQADISDGRAEPDSSAIDDLGRLDISCSSTGPENALGRRRTTLIGPQCGSNTDALGRIRTTLRNQECSATDSDDQGLWEVCEASQGGGTWEALLDSDDENYDDFGNIALMGDDLDDSISKHSNECADAGNEVVDKDRIHSDDHSGPSE